MRSFTIILSLWILEKNALNQVWKLSANVFWTVLKKKNPRWHYCFYFGFAMPTFQPWKRIAPHKFSFRTSECKIVQHNFTGNSQLSISKTINFKQQLFSSNQKRKEKIWMNKNKNHIKNLRNKMFVLLGLETWIKFINNNIL